MASTSDTAAVRDLLRTLTDLSEASINSNVVPDGAVYLAFDKPLHHHISGQLLRQHEYAQVNMTPLSLVVKHRRGHCQHWYTKHGTSRPAVHGMRIQNQECALTPDLASELVRAYEQKYKAISNRIRIINMAKIAAKEAAEEGISRQRDINSLVVEFRRAAANLPQPEPVLPRPPMPSGMVDSAKGKWTLPLPAPGPPLETPPSSLAEDAFKSRNEFVSAPWDGTKRAASDDLLGQPVERERVESNVRPTDFVGQAIYDTIQRVHDHHEGVLAKVLGAVQKVLDVYGCVGSDFQSLTDAVEELKAIQAGL